MTKQFTHTAAATLGALLIATPVFALAVNGETQVSVGSGTVQTSAQVQLDARVVAAKTRADQEIERRISALNDLNARVQGMVRVSGAEKSAISASVSSEIAALTALKTRIDGDSDLDTLKTDVKSITNSYRIFVLIIPQGRIEVAADKIQTTGTLFTQFAVKLQTRITDAQTKGKDVTALTASLTDMNAKIADASVQADAAVALVSGLTPDNDDKTKLQANTQALKDARAKIKAALADLQAARKNAHTIVQALHTMGLETNASASSTAPGAAR